MNSSTELSAQKTSKEKEVPKNYYFLEHEMAPCILEWQKIYFEQKKTENKQQSEELDKKSKMMLKKIMDQTCKVINGVIFRAQYHKREKYDTCFQIAVEACIKALPRFDPTKGTAFNYLSLTAKRSIIYYLIKKNKKKALSLEYEYLGDINLKLKNLLHQEEKTLRNLEIENLTDTVLNLIYEKNQHESLANVAKELREYLFYNQGKYEKKDFFRWAKSSGISANLLRKFTKFLKGHMAILYREVGVY